jgi:hypothetical protein
MRKLPRPGRLRAGLRMPLLGATALVAPVFQADITLTQDLPTVQASVTIAVRGIP